MGSNKKKGRKNDFPIGLLSIIFWFFTLTQFFPMTLLCESNSNIIEKRTALVIGNSAYKLSPLKSAINDAGDMANLLSMLNFKVKLVTDTNKKKMEDAIRTFGGELKQSDIGLVYYSGHGLQVNGENYLIPVGNDIQAEDQVKFKSVNVEFILNKMKSAKSKMNIVILDACRANPFPGIFRPTLKGLAAMNVPPGTLIVYSTAPGQIAPDASGRNSTFTKYLLKYIRTPGLEISTLLQKVASDLGKKTKEEQIPWKKSSIKKDFYFFHSNKKQPGKIVVKGKAYLPNIKLRSEYKYMDSSEIELMVNLKDFYESTYNQTGNFKNSYERIKINGEVIILDITAGLMWQPIDSSRHTFQAAKERLEKMNLKSYAGFSDWRLPTTEEAASLLEKRKNKFPLNIDPIFSYSKKGKNRHLIIWTCDKLNTGKGKWAAVLTGARFVAILDEFERINLIPVRTVIPIEGENDEEN